MQVEWRYRTSGPLSFVALERNQDRRAAELLDDSRGDDTDHTRMPTLGGEHESVRLIEVGRERHEIQQVVHRIGARTHGFRHRHRKLERDARSTEILVERRTARLPRI